MICLPLTVLYLTAGRYLMYIFVESLNGKAMEVGLLFLRIVAPFYIIIAAKLVADSVLRGTGMMRQFMISTFTDLALRVILALLLCSTGLETIGTGFHGRSADERGGASLLFYGKGSMESENKY